MIVEEKDTALAIGSGDLAVLATPAMVALMENAAMNEAAKCCQEGQTTVGTKIAIQHTRATPVGAEVNAFARMTEHDGRRMVFEVWAEDKKGEIGRGEHERFVVESEKFMAKLQNF